MKKIIIAAISILLFACSSKEDAYTKAVAGLEKQTGFFDLFVDKKGGRVLALLPAPDEEGVSLQFIHAGGLTSGLGSNPVGLDRGLFDQGRIIAFRSIGGRLIAEQENWNYRASAENALEKRAIRESFARSFLWSSEILAKGPNGGLLVDLSGFLTRDALDVRGALRGAKQGSFAIAQDRSVPDVSSVLVFPDNVEIDAFLTLESDEPGREVIATAAEGRSFTLAQHHSFVRLPAAGFQSRIFDPRTGGIEIPYYDFSAPLDAPIVKAFARRFRLERTDPEAASGPVKKPIVIYVDPGAPEDIRDALVEGASWWAEAFEKAGFVDAYRVEVLPEDVHPFDVRYNVVQWTHRQTRGWSYGGGVYDPRTGEMIKAHVILGSQRVRQDRMIFEGLAGAERSGSGADDDPVVLALARIRQLAAHEVGHTLGFGHNFAASSIGRASVMDYPAPHVRPTDQGGLDFSESYAIGAGEWDKFAVKWLYTEILAGSEENAALDQIVRDGYAAGMRFVGDNDARSIGTAHPNASLWDNGSDPVIALEEALAVRRIALAGFGPRVLKDRRRLSDLRQVIVPIYLYHRYQVEAAAKLVGGVNFNYGLKDDGLAPSEPVSAEDQRRALGVLLQTLDPAMLDLPDGLLNRLSPRFGGFGPLSGGGETFKGAAEPLFDVVAAADSAGSGTFNALLHPARVSRLVEQNRRDPAALGLDEMLDMLEIKIFTEPSTRRHRAIAQVLQTRFISTLIDLSLSEASSPAAQALADAELRKLRGRLAPALFGGDELVRAHREWLLARVGAHLDRAANPVSPSISAPETPPGSPIGAGFMETCWHCD